MDIFKPPKIMGIINCTPDSFYAGSRYTDTKNIVQTAKAMAAEGADILDLGGESTRPGAVSVDADEQIRRVVPAIQAIREQLSIPVSIDTQSAAVAEAALDAGASIINDISALRHDPDMRKLAAERKVSVILMHMQGKPATMQENPQYRNVVSEVRDFLIRAVDAAEEAGIEREKIILDPGIGFGKRVGDNLVLLRNIKELRIHDLPILIGLSRKSFIAWVLERKNTDNPAAKNVQSVSPENRFVGSLAAHAWCIAQGVDILRVHDVKATRDLSAMWEAIELL